jgi:hypothetical protein
MVIVEGNAREIDHVELQGSVYWDLSRRYPEYATAVAFRVRVRPARLQIPAVCLLAGPKPRGRIVRQPPHVVIEAPPPEDRAAGMQEKIEDCLSFGVPGVGVLSPTTRRRCAYAGEGMREAKDGVLRARDPVVELAPAELFQE